MDPNALRKGKFSQTMDSSALAFTDIGASSLITLQEMYLEPTVSLIEHKSTDSWMIRLETSDLMVFLARNRYVQQVPGTRGTYIQLVVESEEAFFSRFFDSFVRNLGRNPFDFQEWALLKQASGISMEEVTSSWKDALLTGAPAIKTNLPELNMNDIDQGLRMEYFNNYYRRGNDAFRIGNLEEAIRLWKVALKLDPSQEELLERLREAESRLFGSKKEMDHSADDLFQQGMDHYKNGKVAEAIRSWEDVLSINPEHVGAQAAIRSIRKAQEENGDDARQDDDGSGELGDMDLMDVLVDDQIQHAREMLYKGKVEDALKESEEALRIQPGNMEAWKLKSLALLGTGNALDAQATMKRVLEREQTDPANWISMGDIQLELGRFDDALISLDRALSMDERSVDAWFKKGRVFQRMGKLDFAHECLERATDLNPNIEQVWMELGKVLTRMGQYKRAHEAMRRVLDLDPKNEEARRQAERLERGNV